MSEFTLHILGCGSAKPSLRHLPSCQALVRRRRVMIIDCGEGAQLELQRAGLSFARITDIFISHLHGDHTLGLPGLLSTMALHAEGPRTVRVHLPEAGIAMLNAILGTVGHIPDDFKIDYRPLPDHPSTILDEGGLCVTAFPMKHTVPCWGFRFDEAPKPRHLRGDVANFYGIPAWQRTAIKDGADFVTADGRVISNAELTLPPTPSASYAYCSDTLYAPELVVPQVQGAQLLYHEATYLSDPGLEAAACQRGHSTARQAAMIARQADVGRLLMGHYSSRYIDLDGHLAEARAVFANADCANEGMKIELS